jgi:starvation-inducible DNA-binding protein
VNKPVGRGGGRSYGKVILYIGAGNWPFPIPLLEKDGVWRFDPNAGMQEILCRRIGENELTAIATCHEFAAQDHDSAKPTIPSDSFAASLAVRAAGDPVLFHGYYFHVLITRPTNGTLLEKKGKTAGFALSAYPAEYRSSGVVTFAVTASDMVHEKDFRDYHLLLDDQAGQIFAMTGDIAERVRKIGGVAIRSIGHVARLNRLSDNDAEYVDPLDMLAELREDNRALRASMREVHDLCGDENDVATASLLENWIDETERRIWFLFETGRTKQSRVNVRCVALCPNARDV